MEKWNNRILIAAAAFALVGLVFCSGAERALNVLGRTLHLAQRKGCVVIDAGHGGNDPGKVSANGTQEKDINLEIALLVKQYLESQDVAVTLTRSSDDDLAGTESGSRKEKDMRKRIEIIDGTGADLAVSIHQNSYPSEKVKGAQVFYYGESAEGKQLAETLQQELIDTLDPANRRTAKSNNSYYLLKKTQTPIAIVECGFLTNPEEEKKLLDADYRDRAAWAVAKGILEYLTAK